MGPDEITEDLLMIILISSFISIPWLSPYSAYSCPVFLSSPNFSLSANLA